MYNNPAFCALLCHFADLFPEELHILGVLVNICTILIDNRTGNCQGDGIPVTQAHDLDILPDSGIFWPQFVIDEIADILDNSLDIRKRGVPDPKRSIIRSWNPPVVGPEHITEIGGAGPQPAVHNDIAFKVQGCKICAKIIPRRFNGNGVGGNRYVVEPLGCTTVDKDKNGPDDLSATKLRVRFSGYNLPLIGVVVQDNTELFEIFPAERPADRFSNTICNTVRVTDALALDDFDPLFLQRNLG